MTQSLTKATTRNPELVVYALHLLGGAVERIHTEDIARKAHELFPDSFSWTKYPELPDKDIVRVALTDARKEKFGSLIDGRTGQHRGHATKTKRDPVPDGWMLTEAGIRWIRDNEARLQAIARSGDAPKAHRQKALRQLARIRSHWLFVDFSRDPSRFEPDMGSLAELFRCRVDADEAVWVERFGGVRRKAQVTRQDEILRFLDACETAYRAQK